MYNHSIKEPTIHSEEGRTLSYTVENSVMRCLPDGTSMPCNHVIASTGQHAYLFQGTWAVLVSALLIW